jgi:hypothetical protein
LLLKLEWQDDGGKIIQNHFATMILPIAFKARMAR